MKLRNKKTGEIVDFLTIDLIDSDEMEFTYLQASGHENSWSYNSLEKFNEEWEDYRPAEPLIKDEKIRKAVQAFAELNNSATIIFELSYGKSSIIARADNGFAMLWVAGESWETNGKGIKWDEPYTIAELCGEEDKDEA